jgi:hypothetical protein
MGTKVIANLEKEKRNRPAAVSQRVKKNAAKVLILFSVVALSGVGLILADISTPGKAWLTDAEYRAAIGQ